MRRVFKSWIAIAVVAMLAGPVSAAPRGDRERPKEKVPAITKFLKNIVRALGDGLTVPLP